MRMLEYISAPEAAKKWGISERRVQKLCEENRMGLATILLSQNTLEKSARNLLPPMQSNI